MAVRGGGGAERLVPALPVAALRQAVERELSTSSLRQAARESGLSPNALKNFVAGSTPRRTTRVRLERWLAARPAPPRAPSLGGLLKVVGALTPELPPSEATRLGRDMSRLLLDAYHRRSLPPPRWVRELVRHYGD